MNESAKTLMEYLGVPIFPCKSLFTLLLQPIDRSADLPLCARNVGAELLTGEEDYGEPPSRPFSLGARADASPSLQLRSGRDARQTPVATDISLLRYGLVLLASGGQWVGDDLLTELRGRKSLGSSDGKGVGVKGVIEYSGVHCYLSRFWASLRGGG